MVYAMLRQQGSLLRDLIASLKDVEARVILCGSCGSVTVREENPCRLCTDPRRDDRVLCVVEDPSGIALMEQSGGYRGRYHALLGKLSPMRGDGVKNIRMDALVERVEKGTFEEVILALNSDVESDATGSFIREALARFPVKVTKLARGIPAGSGLAYTDAATLQQALQARQAL